MPFKKGEVSNPAGKPKGALNKNNREAARLAQELGIDPFVILLHFANNNWEKLGYKSEYNTLFGEKGIPYEVPIIGPELRVSAAKEACKYIIPQLKAVEHSAADGTSLLAPIIAAPNSVKPEAMGGMGVPDRQPDK